MICIGVDPAPDGFHAVALMQNAKREVFIQTYAEMLPVNHTRFMARAESLLHTHQAMSDVVRDCLAQWGPDRWADPDEDTTVYVFCEEPVVAGARNLRTSLKIAQAVGAIVSGAAHSTLRTYLVPVSKWKKATCGSGSAGKPQVTDWLNHTHPAYAAACGGKQDLVDACCIALYGLSIIADAELVRSVGSSGQL